MAVTALTLIGSVYAYAAAISTSIVHVDLADPSSDPSIKVMEIKADQKTVKAGPVSFVVTNSSKEMFHEMLVVSVANPNMSLPYDSKQAVVIESRIKELGETSDLPPGGKETVDLTLKPGVYLLLCNDAGQYHAGMKTQINVTQ